MNFRMNHLNTSTDIVLDFLRIYLGLALIGKGYYFITNLSELFVLTSTAVSYGDFILSHYIIFAHIVGGACIVFGLLTRAAIMANVPILFGAVAFVHLKQGFFTPTHGLELSMLVFFLLCVSLYHGSGRYSVDFYINRKEPIPHAIGDNIINFMEHLSMKKENEARKDRESNEILAKQNQKTTNLKTVEQEKPIPKKYL